ncbi:MAG: hypothetical protein ACKO4A_13260, partial [Gammaproteobacteria bacterium]
MSGVAMMSALLAVAAACTAFAWWRGSRRAVELQELARSRELALAEAAASTARLVALEESTGGVLLELDADGGLRMARGRTGLLPGLCAGPDPDGTLETLLGADGACVVREALQAAADHGSDAGKVLRLPGGDGARWLELGVTRLPARASGDAACYLLVARDVSARETSARRAIAAREALAVQSREDEYRAAIETSTDGYWAVDPSGRILDV